MLSLSCNSLATALSASRAAAARALLVVTTEFFYFGYWFSHRRA